MITPSAARPEQAAESPAETATLVRESGLPREALQSEHLTSPEVWEALLEDVPITRSAASPSTSAASTASSSPR